MSGEGHHISPLPDSFEDESELDLARLSFATYVPNHHLHVKSPRLRLNATITIMEMQKRAPFHMRAIDEEQLEEFRTLTDNGRYNLTPTEIWWKDRGTLLLEHGYQLRPRLRPGWTPSWQGTDLNPFYCEDSMSLCRQKLVDAVRLSDRKPVVVVNLPRNSDEAFIHRHLLDPGRHGKVDRHVVPILDSFQDDREPQLEFLVLPLLATFDRPPFETVLEVVDFISQMLECLVYMQDSGVAHRDCQIGNMMMDAPGVFPNGFHPCDIERDRGGVYDVKTIPRHKSWDPVRYYIIDFGISRIYQPGDAHEVVGDDGAERDIPEMSDFRPYDPFPADVFIMGNTFKKYLLQKYEHLDFLSPVVDAMTARKASKRPSAADALRHFRSLVYAQGYFKLRQQLVPKGETRRSFKCFRENIGILADAALYPAIYVVRLPKWALIFIRNAIASRRTNRLKI